VHGIERWRSNCGCNSGGHPGWNQEWRTPLRGALDWIRDVLTPLFETRAKELLKDPWAARNDYIDVVLDRSAASLGRFLAKHSLRQLDESEKITVWKLMELQRHAMLMYTSCGWFFDELSGIETVQVMQYAGRAVQLAEELFGDQRESRFIAKLSQAKSNIPEQGDGGRIYQKLVTPAFVDLRKVGAHYAIRSLFDPYESDTHIYQYKVERQTGLDLANDKDRQKLTGGRARFTSGVTQESAVLGFAALDSGDINPVGGVLKASSAETFEAMAKTLREAFSRADPDEVRRILKQNFEGEPYDLTVLFRDEQRRILNRIVESEWKEAEVTLSDLYPHVMSMIRTLVKIGGYLTIPRAFYAAAEFALNTRLRHALDSEQMDFDVVRSLLKDAEETKVALDMPTLEYTLRKRLEQIAEGFHADPGNVAHLKEIDSAVGLTHSLPLSVNLWKIQNICYEVLQTTYHNFQQKAEEGDENAIAWVVQFRDLAQKLSLRVA
jgi:hypothetical protein